MSGEQILPLRLPPSGALVLDALSQQPLELGDGTPGLIWRSRFVSNNGGTLIGGAYATPVVIPGLGGACALKSGFWYDLEFSLALEAGAGVTVNDLVVLLEGSYDNGATWTEGFGVFLWGQMALLSGEATTVASGTLRFPLGNGTTPDITNVRVRAGASGNAGDREVFGGWLRIEQFTQGDTPEDFRLNASGSFLEDRTTNATAQAGTGTPGLIWRAQNNRGAIDIGGSSPQLIGDLTNPWALPAGYHYDVKLCLTLVDTVAGGTGDLHLIINGSTDNGSSYFVILDQTLAATELARHEARQYFTALMNYVPTADITNIQVWAAGWVAGRAVTSAWLKAEQYVK
jgi:hypothetical protein